LSQYPNEAEVLFGPLTGLEAVNDGYIAGTIRHFTIRPTVNQRAVRRHNNIITLSESVFSRPFDRRTLSIFLSIVGVLTLPLSSQVRIEILVEQRKELHKQTLTGMRQELVGKITNKKLLERFDEHVSFVNDIKGLHFNVDRFNRCALRAGARTHFNCLRLGNFMYKVSLYMSACYFVLQDATNRRVIIFSYMFFVLFLFVGWYD
jgi:hypothetical protein